MLDKWLKSKVCKYTCAKKFWWVIEGVKMTCLMWGSGDWNRMSLFTTFFGHRIIKLLVYLALKW